MKDKLFIRGRLKMEVWELTPWMPEIWPGQIPSARILYHVQDNLITDVGLNMIRDLIGRDAPGTGGGFRPAYLALGTGTTLPAETDTTLETEVFRKILTARKGVDKTFIGQMHVLTTEANGNTITEAGLFDAPAPGNMLCRTKLDVPLVKTASVEVTFTWDITIGRL